MKNRTFFYGLFLLALALPFSLNGADEVRLLDLEISDSEWGTIPNDMYPNSGPSVVDWGSAGNMGGHWKGPKIVKEIQKGYTLPEGKVYVTDMLDCFAVGGEFVTGVGLLARRMDFYHWVEYAIPANMSRFNASLCITDDARGFQWWGNANQQFDVYVLIDEKEVYKNSKTRTSLEHGSGEELDTIAIDIPKGSKKIRFKVQNSPWGDGNSNTELVLKDAKFSLRKK
ncbi:MAG: NPCBM/NEW2 domain-containing protein [Verrucomicrobiota bacterium]|nr:NPCBM/NEW2 domain-containing protein [Verrucomicrobiota bacterium]